MAGPESRKPGGSRFLATTAIPPVISDEVLDGRSSSGRAVFPRSVHDVQADVSDVVAYNPREAEETRMTGRRLRFYGPPPQAFLATQAASRALQLKPIPEFHPSGESRQTKDA